MSPYCTSSTLHPRNFIQAGNPTPSVVHIFMDKVFCSLGVTQPGIEKKVIIAFAQPNESLLIAVKAAGKWARCASALVLPHWGTGAGSKAL